MRESSTQDDLQAPTVTEAPLCFCPLCLLHREKQRCASQDHRGQEGGLGYPRSRQGRQEKVVIWTTVTVAMCRVHRKERSCGTLTGEVPGDQPSESACLSKAGIKTRTLAVDSG